MASRGQTRKEAVATERAGRKWRHQGHGSRNAIHDEVQGKVQAVVTHHARSHAQGVQTRFEASVASFAYESRRVADQDEISREASKSLTATTAYQLATLLSRMRVQAVDGYLSAGMRLAAS